MQSENCHRSARSKWGVQRNDRPTYPAVTASEGEGNCTARLCRLLHTPASLKATQGQWHHSAQPPTQGTTEGRRAPYFFVSCSDVQNLAAINHRIYIYLSFFFFLSVENIDSRDWAWQFCWLPQPKNLILFKHVISRKITISLYDQNI